MDPCCSVYVTCPDPAVAETLARAAVEHRLAACANMLPGATSVYRWEGRVVTDTETVVFFKTRTALFEPLRALLTSLHPYTVPCIVLLPIQEGHPPYLDWIRAETAGQPA